MADSATPRPRPADRPANPALAPLQAFDPPFPVGVAYSGGADSTALLLAAAERWPGRVHALHVHHGLQAAADAFEARCASTCADAGVPLHVQRVDARHQPGESPEDAARRARYGALAQAARQAGIGCVLLAQHADDQVETVLLALSRGAGLPGLAAMPVDFDRDGVTFLRPLLDTSGAALREWLAAAGIPFVDDPSNADTRFTRNRIRHTVLPAIAAAFPTWRVTFARSARHAAQAQRLLDEVAAQDLDAMDGSPLLARLQVLSRDRQANVLRHWLRAFHDTAASAAQLDELLDQVADCTTRGHAVRLRVGTGHVLREGPRLRFDPA
ncbi:MULTISPECIES: tRNA lysidine(34) synthetase TilS [Ramlibacter]|uniref:tRNA(Ile)-lysidine synthase n=1 Tax=Ramlibacter pinisoli TaxID=2682844 RepID=A0A6N8INY7_9BURK|nr:MULTISPECIES: tRNA lysidine(34) synthetase TilS [Ramlibacter]MBA2963455.1 tRNA lysidine(34) synthetase TilS [Ramlibacter sp. CGMCC 1.13660]MVQ28422.1 tRNA lysidine(34) synthetase TilS [Ramlibacter pinisoli]